MAAEENKAVVRQQLARIDARDVESVIALYSPYAILHGFGPGSMDVPTYRLFISTFLNAFPDARFTVEDIFAEGDRVAARYTWRGIHQDEFMGVPPTYQHVQISTIAIYRLENGKIAEVWTEDDNLHFMQRLGILQPQAHASTTRR